MRETTASDFCTLCMIALSVTSSVMSPGRKPCCLTASGRKDGSYSRSDANRAWVAAYPTQRRRGASLLHAEWLRAESRRDLWSDLYAAPSRTPEAQLRFLIELEPHAGP